MPYEKFSADNAALLLIDHQIGTMGWVKSIAFGYWATPEGGQLVQVVVTALQA